jgi:hypothetical protein
LSEVLAVTKVVIVTVLVTVTVKEEDVTSTNTVMGDGSFLSYIA